MVGLWFGRLTIMSVDVKNHRSPTLLKCECICGKTCQKPAYQVLRGSLVSCGCAKREQTNRDNRQMGSDRRPGRERL